MSTLRVSLLQDVGTFAFGQFAGAQIEWSNGKTVKYIEGDGDYLILTGKNLTVEGGVLVDGTITSMTHYNIQEVKYCSLTGFKFDAENLPAGDANFSFFASQAMMKGRDVVLGTNGSDPLGGWNGRDTIKAFGGDDIIYGHQGNDRITGGRGLDTFIFSTGDGDDTITDFDPRGEHDSINVSNAFTARQHGHDTIIEFDNGDSITLLDFRKSVLEIGDIS